MPCYVHWGIVKVALAKAQQISNVFPFFLSSFWFSRFSVRRRWRCDDELWRSSQLPLSRPIHAGAWCRWPPGFNRSLSALMKIYENVVKDGKHNVNIWCNVPFLLHRIPVAMMGIDVNWCFQKVMAPLHFWSSWCQPRGCSLDPWQEMTKWLLWRNAVFRSLMQLENFRRLLSILFDLQ